MSDTENQIVETVETVPVDDANIVVNTMLRTIQKLTLQLDNARSKIGDLEEEKSSLRIELNDAKSDIKKQKSEIENLSTVFETLNEAAKKKDAGSAAYPCYECNKLFIYDMTDGQGGICTLCNRCADCGCQCRDDDEASDSDDEDCECGKNEEFDSDEIEGLVICPVCTETYLCNACIGEDAPEDAVCKKCQEIINQ